MVAALYAALMMVLAPVSFGPIQLRVADCLIPLSAILGWPVNLGVSFDAFKEMYLELYNKGPQFKL